MVKEEYKDRLDSDYWKNLSEKILDENAVDSGYIDVQDIKEFIKRLKEECSKWLGSNDSYNFKEVIDKLSGDKLT